MKTQYQLFIFDKEPSFAQLWDKCVYGLLYDIDKYTRDIKNLFTKLGVKKQSKIIDVSAGGGFPALDLVRDGYNITCVDGFQDEVDLFNQKAAVSGSQIRCAHLKWENLLDSFEKNIFDFLFCRGNSFIYACGGWNEMVKIEPESALLNYKQTLFVFYDLIKPGGWIYIDKFKDSETTHKEKVCDIKVGDGPKEDLVFWTQRFSEQKIRKASMIRKIDDMESGVPNITYDLLDTELENMLVLVGFKNIQKIDLVSEQHFDIWLAQK